jgi:spore coat protein A, manganese oxidase
MPSRSIQLLGSLGFWLLHLAACGVQAPGAGGELSPETTGPSGEAGELEERNGDLQTAAQALVAATPLPGAQITKWATKLEEPPVYVPSGAGGVPEYRVTVRETAAQMLPEGFPPTRVLAYGGRAKREGSEAVFDYEGTPGATFVVQRGVPVRVTYVNEITTPSLFPIDTSVHWANPAIPPGQDFLPVPHVTHLHGLEVTSGSDGHPEAWFTADGQRGPGFVSDVYDYPNAQPATTLWYHDHTLGITRLNVYAGLAGMYLIRDPGNPIENPPDGIPVLPDEAHEMPLVIADKSFNDDGTLAYPATFQPFFFGDANVVNGKVWPQMEVERAKYRFRVVNASNHRFYRLGLDNGNASLTVIGSDGGFLAKAASVSQLLLAPGERADVLIDFSGVTSEEPVVLTNTIGRTGTGSPEAQMSEVVRFTVPAGAPQQPALADLPAELNTIAPLTPDVTRRTVTLNASGLLNFLDGQSFHSPTSELPRVGSTEEWDIVNLTANIHSIHLHLIQFQIVGRQAVTAGYNTEWTRLNGNTLPLQQPTQKVAVEPFLSAPTFDPPAAPEAGWKDTIVAPRNAVTRIRVRWAPQQNDETPQPGVNPFPFDPTNPNEPGYIWHCHLLEHEDHDMMRSIELVK